MPLRMKITCKKPLCSELLDAPGYCKEHTTAAKKGKNYFYKQDRAKTQIEINFYNSNRWREASKRHRKIEPFCRPCRNDSKLTLATLTHHKPELKYLLDNNLDPCNEEYLISCCDDCHLKELRKKKQSIPKYHTQILDTFYKKNKAGGVETSP